MATPGTIKPDDLFASLIDIEDALLCALMWDRYDWAETPGILTLNTEDFVRDRNKWLFAAVKAIHGAGLYPDFLTVALYLRQYEPAKYAALKGAFGPTAQAYVWDLIQASYDRMMLAIHIEQWATILKQESRARQEYLTTGKYKPALINKGIDI